MAQGDRGRVALDLKLSICTDNPTGTDIYSPGSPEAMHVENTGIERQGGLTSLYEQETTFATAGANSIITKSGDTLQVDASDDVRLNDKVLGNVGSLSVYNRGSLAGYIDAAWTADSTILALTRDGTAITIYELDPANIAILHSRVVTFAGLVLPFIKTLTFIRYVDMHYADNQEFFLSYSALTTTDQVLKESGTSITQAATPGYDLAEFAHRLGANRYVWGKQGYVSWYMGDILFGGAGYTVQTNAKWCIIDRWRGLGDSRAVYAFDVYKNAANTLTGIATAGYDGAGGYSATIAPKGLALAAVTVILQNLINGPGYSEATYTRSDTGTNIYSYSAIVPTHTDAAYYLVVQSQTQTPQNFYGKLTDIAGNHTFLVSWRMLMVNGVPAVLSAAGITAGTTVDDHLGVPITNVGEIDPYFVPHIIDTANYSRIIYRNNGTLFYVDIRAAAGHTISAVSETVYQVNTLSPINIVDTRDRMLHLGVNDYNGRLRFQSTDPIVAVSKASSILSGAYSNSIDVGDKLITQTPPNGFYPLGYAPPAFWRGPTAYTVRLFSDDVYIYSSSVPTNLYSDLSQVGTLYIPDTRLPVAMGYSYGDKVAFTDIETLFLGVGVLGSADVDYAYVGYELGNQVDGTLVSWEMFGQRYLYDGFDIFLANFNGPIFTGRQIACPAPGVTFIAADPVRAYFFSAFDNSVYIFDGGRSLTKLHRLNDLRNSANVIEPILDGVYNVRDGTLLMQTAGTFVWVRDSVISQTFKKANQTSITLYDTAAGIAIANNTLKWVYSFEALASPASTVVPFVFKSAYFGVGADVMMTATAFDVTLYSPSKAAAAVTLTCDFIDADGTHTQTAYQNLTPSDWSALGLFRCRIRPGSGDPASNKVIAASVGVAFSTKLVLTDISMEWTEDVAAVPAAERSV